MVHVLVTIKILRDLGLRAFPITKNIGLFSSKDTVNAKVIFVIGFLKPLIGAIEIHLENLIRKKLS